MCTYCDMRMRSPGRVRTCSDSVSVQGRDLSVYDAGADPGGGGGGE